MHTACQILLRVGAFKAFARGPPLHAAGVLTHIGKARTASATTRKRS